MLTWRGLVYPLEDQQEMVISVHGGHSGARPVPRQLGTGLLQHTPCSPASTGHLTLTAAARRLIFFYLPNFSSAVFPAAASCRCQPQI